MKFLSHLTLMISWLCLLCSQENGEILNDSSLGSIYFPFVPKFCIFFAESASSRIKLISLPVQV